MQLDKVILRVFEVRARQGNATLLKQKLSDTSVSVVQGKPGNLGHMFGEVISTDENDLVFVSVWKDLDAVKARFGEEWEQSFLPAGYGDIGKRTAIHSVVAKGEGMGEDKPGSMKQRWNKTLAQLFALYLEGFDSPGNSSLDKCSPANPQFGDEVKVRYFKCYRPA